MKTSTQSSRGLLIFGLFWTAFSSLFLVIGLKLAYDAVHRSAWDEVDCTVSHLEIKADRNASPPFQPAVSYSYRWQGATHTGNRVWASKKGEDDYEDLGELIAQHQHGKLTRCHVNPDDPSESVLITGTGDIWGGLAFALFGAGFVAIGIGLIIVSRKQKNKERSALSSKKKNGDAPKAILIPFFSVFAIVGLGVFAGVIVPQWMKYTDAKSWKATPAKVIWSRVESHSSDDGTTYSVDIFYQYQFQGKPYKSNTTGLMSGSSSGRAGKQKKVDQHPAGKSITCYVNPDRPWQAIIDRDLGWWVLFALFPLPFIAVGVGGLWHTLRKRSHARKKSDDYLNDLRSRPSSHQHSASGSDDFHHSAQKDFSPGSGRVKWFIGSIAIGIFWNGITSVFVWQAIKSWQSNNPEWFLILFITPFVLIGIGLIGNIIYRLLALFNPAPRINLTPGNITLGQPAKLKWNVGAGSHRMNHFAIYLVGEEEAQYRRGTNTVTDTRLFYQHALIDTQDPRKSISGSATIDLPTQSGKIMPSWKSSHNRIKWSLHVKGDIAIWPDVSDRYEVTVLAAHITH
ncbi:MAG: DUF3592 domain-containing protein [Verrucomicrobiae bacterium]|nr:DUF3592 domain-containing protein [Verrucomicrobiae bacterium]NNJ42630.1 DUF3592 domain-containing protein [Akkermansiaceae bacterium]